MGVYINMEMPKNGSCIQIVIDDDGKVYPSVEKCILKMGSIAKAVPVPPHGRLIDADALCNRLITAWDIADMEKKTLVSAVMANVVTPIVVGTPTVITAEEGK